MSNATQQPNFEVTKETGSKIVDVTFDEGGFASVGYDVKMADYLRFKNGSMSPGTLTVYVLTTDGQSPMPFLLGCDSLQLSAGAMVIKPVKTFAEALLSLGPAPQSPPSVGDPDGQTVPIKVSP